MAVTKNKARADGRLQSKIYIGNGKYKYVYAYSPKELQKKIDEVKFQLGKGLDITSQRDTFGLWSERWLKVKKIEISPKRYISYKACVDKFTSLNNVPINKIRTSDLQEVIIDNAQLSHYTLTSIKNTAKQICDYAISSRVMDYNPALYIKIPKRTFTEKDEGRRALTQIEQSWIVSTPHRAKTSAMIMMYAGLRRGELIPLLWSDIDLDKGTITVSKSVSDDNGKLKIKNSAKSESSIRKVYIPQVLIQYLKDVPKTSSLVTTPSHSDKMHTETTWRTMWESYLTELNIKYGDFSNIENFKENYCIQNKDGTYRMPSKFSPKGLPMAIPNITPHWLRHTFITLMYLAGVDVLTAKEQAGHADIKTTMSIYTHLDNIYKHKQMTKLNDYLNL